MDKDVDLVTEEGSASRKKLIQVEGQRDQRAEIVLQERLGKAVQQDMSAGACSGEEHVVIQDSHAGQSLEVDSDREDQDAHISQADGGQEAEFGSVRLLGVLQGGLQGLGLRERVSLPDVKVGQALLPLSSGLLTCEFSRLFDACRPQVLYSGLTGL